MSDGNKILNKKQSKTKINIPLFKVFYESLMFSQASYERENMSDANKSFWASISIALS